MTGDGPATADLSGRLVGNSYVLVCPVGHGATGTVWRGIDRSTGADVAVKLLHEGLLRQPKLVIRFVQERTILMMMRHENIVGVRDLFSAGGSLALVMDYVSGGSLRTHLRAEGTLAPAGAADLLSQVAAALAQAHELGVVHRDVKPDNILLQENAGRLAVRLTDFGIARVLDTAGLTTPQAIVGTPHYMAPEAIQGEAVPASDVYSAGVVLYELLTGLPPYAGEPLAVLRGHLDEVPQRPPGLPHPVWELITWCLAKDPDRRPTAAELGAALRELSRATAGVPALPAPEEEREVAPTATPHLGVRAVSHPSVRRTPARKRPRNGPRSWMWRRPWAMVALMAGVLAMSGVSGFNAWQLLRDGGADPAVAAPQTQTQQRAQPGGHSRLGSSGGPRAGTDPSGAATGLPALAAVAPSPPALTGGELPEAAAPSATPSRAAEPGGGGVGVGVGASAGPGGARAEATLGPWVCGDQYDWDLGHPVLARPCHAVGGGVRVVGQMEAMPGVQADIALTLRDASTNEVLAGPYTCKGLMFTDFALKHACGPVDLNPPRGRRLVVVETWEYTSRPLIPGGTARGPEFSW
ncbi:serine/threonine-protein kinase [Paractinoplanes abujensis]|uniref:non-specific serine/threonine protein kinase n=1 Tax=Paractinoplanes abujensis TaxID=882441 RepID=A0A7W7FZU9_9ACTN|nr:serine/threonine-protein kinase [Actinoplanes abujensis]MBB4690445.1 serine/threonine-protein kinase [Actinoplanes abujensis]